MTTRPVPCDDLCDLFGCPPRPAVLEYLAAMRAQLDQLEAGQAELLRELPRYLGDLHRRLEVLERRQPQLELAVAMTRREDGAPC